MLTASLSFFEWQPMGLILNRMSTDMDFADTRIMKGVDMALSAVIASIASEV
jgi:hypothetical protein